MFDKKLEDTDNDTLLLMLCDITVEVVNRNIFPEGYLHNQLYMSQIDFAYLAEYLRDLIEAKDDNYG